MIHLRRGQRIVGKYYHRYHEGRMGDRKPLSQLTKDEWAATPNSVRGEMLDAVAPHLDEAVKERLTHGLCARCSKAVIYRQDAGEPTTHCRSIGRTVPNNVTECSSFEPPGTMSLWDMGKLAWIIDPRPNGGGVYL